jgi:hypothetical protein
VSLFEWSLHIKVEYIYKEAGDHRGTRLENVGQVLSFLNFHPDDKVTSFEELKIPFPGTSFLIPRGVPSYHSVLLLHTERGQAMCIEKVPTGLEVMVGSWETLADYARTWGVFRQKRTEIPSLRPVINGERGALLQGVSLQELTEWLEQIEARHPYCLLQANCQHFCQDAQQFLRRVL